MTEVINILFLIPCMGDGGIESMIISWIRALNSEKYHVDVFTQRITSNKTRDKLEELGVTIYSSECRNRNILVKRKFYKSILKLKKYTIVHLHTCFAPEFILLKWSKDSKIKIRIAHGHNAFEHKNIKDILVQKAAHPFMRYYATEYVGCSDQAAIEILGKKGIKAESYRKINNSIDTDKLRFSHFNRKKVRSDLGIEEKYVIGHVGRMTEQKNHSFLLDIFKQCLEIKPNAILMLIGDGELRNQIEMKAQRLAIKDKIIFVGVTSEVAQYLSAMDHFLFPSIYEGFSVALLEAQCNGLGCTVSSEIVQEAVILSTTHIISLNESPQKWAVTVCENRQIWNRSNAADIIKDNGYDIKDNNLNDYYQMLLRG